VALGVLSLIYLFYLGLAVLAYTQYWFLLSERRRHDLKFAPLLVIYPLYAFFCRCWNGFSTLAEIVVRTHRDTIMAPWWVLKRNDF
jgi:hypothetical protein